ncbi:MAG: biotin/lipoyl-containing protein, partial [Kingella oralis]
MIVEVNVPVFAESITEGTLLKWYKKVGESVARDETLVDIETDKVVLEVPAPQAGVLVEIVVQDGETVTTQQLLAKIDTAAVAMQAAPAEIQAASAALQTAAPASNSQAGVAMPAAAKLAAEKGVDVSQIQGSG